MSDQSVYHGPAYTTEAHGSIPASNSYEEEANFWDTHSITDLKAETDHELEAIARARVMKKATLIRTWVLERLRQDRNRHAS